MGVSMSQNYLDSLVHKLYISSVHVFESPFRL